MAISFLKIQSNLRKFVVDLKNVYISEKELEAFKLGFETKYNSNEKTFQVIFNYLNSEEAVKEVLRIVPKKDYAILTLGVVSGIVALNQDYNREITNFLKEKRESVEGLELGFVKKLLKIQETQLNLIPATFHFALKGTKDTKMITENGEIEEFSEAFLKESSKLLS
jgi:wobble nucleotide-excising tRNase